MFDTILKERIGDGGIWQWKIFLLTTIASNMAWVYLPVFAFDVPKHHCRSPYFESLGWSREEIVRMTTPGAFKIKNYADIDSSCERHAMLYLRRAIGRRNVTYEEALHIRDHVYRNLSRIKRFKCTYGITYTERDRVFNHSLGVEFNIACDREYWQLVTKITYSFAMMLGYIVAGVLSDKYGRKKIGMLFGSTSLIFGIGTAFSNSVLLFSVLRAISGFLISGIWITTNILVSECTSRKYRNVFNVLQNLYFSCGVAGSYALMAYLVQEWRFLQLLISLPAATAAFFIWFIPESPRWLLTLGHYDEARNVITQAILVNTGQDQLDRVIPVNVIPEGSVKNSKKQFGDQLFLKIDDSRFCCRSGCCGRTRLQVGLLFCHRQLLFRFLYLLATFIATLTCLYGLQMTGFGVPGLSPYATLFINVLISVPASFAGMVAFIFFDRKRPHIIVAAIMAVLALVNAITIHVANKDRTQAKLVVSSEISWFLNIVAILIIACVHVLLDMMNLRAMELFPTYIRNSAYGFVHGFGRIGMAIGLYLQTVKKMAPLSMYIFSLCGVVIIAMVLLSDSDNGRVLVDTIEQFDASLTADKTRQPKGVMNKRKCQRRRNSKRGTSLIASEGFPDHSCDPNEDGEALESSYV